MARDGWLASFLELDMLSCQDCGRVEFYRPGYLTLPEVAEDPEEQDQVTCPVCGTRHSPWSTVPSAPCTAPWAGSSPRGRTAPRETEAPGPEAPLGESKEVGMRL